MHLHELQGGCFTLHAFPHFLPDEKVVVVNEFPFQFLPEGDPVVVAQVIVRSQVFQLGEGQRNFDGGAASFIRPGIGRRPSQVADQERVVIGFPGKNDGFLRAVQSQEVLFDHRPDFKEDGYG